ncbi:MAG: phosphoenolpyruvate synthase, partial [Lysinibacillus sp.]|nr:phosphoenolpyruvate synthase [Lysinibacillus sp.]
MKKYISTFHDPGSIEQDGGKGHNLKVLTQSGFNVPTGIVLHANFYKEHYEKPIEFNYSDTVKLEKQCRAMQEKVKREPLPTALVDEIKKHVNPDFLYAVRSSSTFEDLEGSAFAGQHETYLNTSVEGLEEKIKECFASLWNMHAVVYRHERGFSQKEASMAVVIQQMVPSESAGVAFSVDPISGKFDRVLIESSFGLGENVVAGESLTDT